MSRTPNQKQLLANLAYELILSHGLYSNICTENNISCSQLIVLKRLSEIDETCCKKMCLDLEIVPSTFTGICNVLEKKGYITRHYSALDRRQVYISLTDSGKSCLQHVHDTMIESLRLVSQTFDESDIEKTTVLLQEFNRQLRTEKSNDNLSKGLRVKPVSGGRIHAVSR